ncbi:MAG: hypothetical protein F6J90_33395 [Moorea sp. SIOASIH]|uniref:hypothetical protein n=1 Tax=Moorena sp. SIOASIH TaxID=2607817 RepID=UPI0013BBE247|nr:hypothetical protein [Moorena sp. SIOASIH]NEO40964.1 hypothetical protein [Moorena sp. SIOASIH]
MEAIFLDFDGVIVDSLEEWYHIGVLAYYGIDKAIHDNQHKELYKKNCHLLYSDADEYCLLKALDNQDLKNFKKNREEVDKQEVDIYSKQFRKIRKFYQKNHLNWWCGLHSLTDYGKTLTNQKNTKNHFIITRKDMDDVLILKNHFKIQIPDLKVFDYSHSVKYGGKVDFIERFLDNHPEYNKAVLVDDKIENLCKSSKVKCYFASWGYGKGNNEFETYKVS